MSLSAIVLTYNEEHHIVDCIASLRWAESVFVFDSFSTDNTVVLAERAGATVIQHHFEDYSKQRQAALEKVAAEWIFFVDADERSTPEQAAEILAKINDPKIDAYGVPRHNYICGKLTKGAGWFPDYQVRLLRRSKVRYDLTREVHEIVIVEGQSSVLDNPLIHYNYQDWGQFFDKQRRYTNYAAQEMYHQRVRIKPQNYILQPLRHFYWRFITLKGYRDGLHGLRLSLIMAYFEFQKYLRLNRLWRASR